MADPTGALCLQLNSCFQNESSIGRLKKEFLPGRSCGHGRFTITLKKLTGYFDYDAAVSRSTRGLMLAICTNRKYIHLIFCYLLLFSLIFPNTGLALGPDGGDDKDENEPPASVSKVNICILNIASGKVEHLAIVVN